MSLKSLVDPYTQALFGIHAVRAPVQLAVQRVGEHLLSAVLITRGDLTFGSEKAQQLVIGDAVIRPHAVVETDAFQGRGLSGLAMTPVEEWIECGHILMNPAGVKL